MFASRRSDRVDFGFASTAVQTVSPTTAKTTGTRCGRLPGDIVASRATRPAANRSRARCFMPPTVCREAARHTGGGGHRRLCQINEFYLRAILHVGDHPALGATLAGPDALHVHAKWTIAAILHAENIHRTTPTRLLDPANFRSPHKQRSLSGGHIKSNATECSKFHSRKIVQAC